MTVPTLHGTLISLNGVGILIRGASGAGKSSLALRLMEERGARLVTDDRVVLSQQGKHLWGSAPDSLAGLLEVRGLGIVKVPFIQCVAISLVADLVPIEDFERYPTEENEYCTLKGVQLRKIFLLERNPDNPVIVAFASKTYPILQLPIEKSEDC